MTATQWGEVLVSYSVQVLAVMLIGKMLQPKLVRASDQCALWSTCFFSTLVLAAAALFLPRLHLLQPWSQLEPHMRLSISEIQIVVGRVLLAIWCLGASVSLIQWIARGQMLRHFLRRCERMPAPQVEQLFGSLAAEAAGKELPGLLISDEVAGPFCWQLHEPLIVLPRFLVEGSRDDLRHVLVHELEHLKTHHPMQLFIQNLAQVICWFHPAVWRAARRASLSREFACDDAAARNGLDCAAYLRTLLHIAERCNQTKNLKMIGFSRSAHEVVVRAHRLVKLANDSPGKLYRGRLRRNAAICAVLFVTCLVSQAWLPLDALASSRSSWSPWPTWTAKSLYGFGVRLRDYEAFDRRVQLHELLSEKNSRSTSDEIKQGKSVGD